MNNEQYLGLVFASAVVGSLIGVGLLADGHWSGLIAIVGNIPNYYRIGKVVLLNKGMVAQN